MALEVIGAGFGRTGTLSLKFALEHLGLGPCYHMMEVRKNPTHSGIWQHAVNNEPVDWKDLFQGYKTVVDWPAAEFWSELCSAYPDAKVILSLREPEGWYKSVCNTIMTNLTSPLPDEPEQRKHRAMTRSLILDRVFGGQFEVKAHAIEVFNANLAKVREQIPAERLLEYRPGDGWVPLCEFLGVAVPEEDYPNVNSSAEFKERWAAIATEQGR